MSARSIGKFLPSLKLRLGTKAVICAIFLIAVNTALVVGAAEGVLSNDGTPLTGITAVLVSGSGPTHGTLTVTLGATGSFTYKPNTGYLGSDSFKYKDQDAFGNFSNEATVTINIGNNAPAASNPSR